MPIHLKIKLIVEVALMHNYGIVTVLLFFSEHASPISAQWKPSRRLRLKINGTIADDYTKNKHPASTLSDAA